MQSIGIIPSPGYTKALEYVEKIVSKVEVDRSQNRYFALSTIRRVIEAPSNAYGMMQTREITEEVLSNLHKQGRILSYEIRPRYSEDGPEWAFFTIKRRYKRRSTEVVPDAGTVQASRCRV